MPCGQWNSIILRYSLLELFLVPKITVWWEFTSSSVIKLDKVKFTSAGTTDARFADSCSHSLICVNAIFWIKFTCTSMYSALLCTLWRPALLFKTHIDKLSYFPCRFLWLAPASPDYLRFCFWLHGYSCTCTAPIDLAVKSLDFCEIPFFAGGFFRAIWLLRRCRRAHPIQLLYAALMVLRFVVAVLFGGDILALPPTFCSSHAIASIFIMLGSIFYMENYYLVWNTNCKTISVMRILLQNAVITHNDDRIDKVSTLNINSDCKATWLHALLL
jgi:hypothetical protein